jgi:putative membrane protein
MKAIALLLTGLVAIEHVYILWLEMFAWESRGPKVFIKA